MSKFIADENGTIIDEIKDNEMIIKINAGDKVVRKKSLDYFEDTKELKKRFVKVNDQAISLLNKYGKYICCLLKYVGYLDGVLKFNNGICLTNKTIAKIFGINERNAVRILNDLIKEDVIHKHKEKNKNYYTFNPWIASRGKRVSIDLYNEFKMTAWVNVSQEPSDYETVVRGDYK